MIWEVVSPSAVGINESKLDFLHKRIEDETFKQLQSILIVRDDKLAYETYFQGTDFSHRHNVRSASKAITSTAIGIAIDTEYISGVDAPVYPFFEDVYSSFEHWNDAEKRALTIRDLLTMTSCLECDDWNEFSRGNEERMYLIKDWVKFTLDLPVRGVRWEPAQGDNPPVYDFSYCTGGVVVLGALLEQATGMSFAEFVDVNLFQPLQITDYEWSYTPTRHVMTGGGLNIRSRDMAVYGCLYLNKGFLNGEQIVSEAWIDESWRVHATIDDEQTFGYLWWRRSFDVNGQKHRSYFAAGNGGQTIWVFPDLDMVVVMTSTAYGTRYGNRQPVQILQDYILPAIT